MKDKRERALEIANALFELYEDAPSVRVDILALAHSIEGGGEVSDKERKRLTDIICDVVALSESLCEILKGVDE